MANRFSTLRIGIAGAGLMGHWHAKSAQRLGAKVIAVLDQDLYRAQKISAGLDDTPAVYTNIEDLLAQSKPDILHICTPLESHYPIAMQAIESGVHVIIEKPVTATAIGTKSLLTAAHKSGVSICPVHQFGFQGGVQVAIKELDSLGDLLEIRFTACSAGGVGRVKSDLNQIIADIIPHPLSLMQRLCPGISFDTCSWQGAHSRDGELRVIASLEGIAINISISMNSRPTRCEMELFCSKGRIFLNLFHGYAVVERGRVSRVQKLMQPFKYFLRELISATSNLTSRGLKGEFAYPGLGRLLESFYESVVAGTPSPISTEDTFAVATARDHLIGQFLPDNVTIDLV